MFKKKNRDKFILLFILFAISLVIVLLYNFSTNCPKYGCLSINNLEQFRTSGVYQDDKNIYRALLSNDNDLIRIEVRKNVKEESAQKDIQGEIVRMKALFENALSPYPGELSNEIQCAKEFKPALTIKKINNTEVSYFNGFLNERMVFGSCVKEQAVYKGILALFYCSSKKQLFQLELITLSKDFLQNPSKYQQMIESIKCTD